MPEVGERLGDAAMKVVEQRGIDVRLGTTLKEGHDDHVVLSADSVLGPGPSPGGPA